MHRHLFPLAVVLCFGLAFVLTACRQGSTSASEAAAKAESVPVTKQAGSNEIAYEEQTRAHVDELEKMADARQLRDQAAQKTEEARTAARLLKRDIWAEVIKTNWQTFQALRQEAARSPDKKVPCTICNAKGVVNFCVVCDHTGKCPTCDGTGKIYGDVCPACLGNSKCFHCFGSGKMPCPFCQSLPDKEVITVNTPPPSNQIPIN